LLKVYCTNLENSFPDLPEDILESAEKFKNTARKKEYLAGRYLALKGLKESGFEGEIEFKIKDSGKVYVENAPDFSISHDGEFVVCAFSEYSVGADVVNISRFSKIKPNRYFNDNEKNFVGFDAKKNALLWSVKEAYGKMTGEGLSRRVSETDFSAVFMQNRLPQGLFVNGVYLWSDEKNGCIITVCTSENIEPKLFFEGI